MLYKIIAFLLFLQLLLSPISSEAQMPDLSSFARLPVMHEGRVKPMDSFAQSLMKRFSGREKGALIWLSEAIFNPAFAETQPVFKVRNPDVRSMLELEPQRQNLFSYKALSKALNRKQAIVVSILEVPVESWTPAQKDLIHLQENIVLFGDVLAGLSLFLPLSMTLPESVPSPLDSYANSPLSYLKSLKFRQELEEQVRKTVSEKGEDITLYTYEEQAMAYLSFTISNLQMAGERSMVFRVVPMLGQMSPWLSPWQTLLEGQGGPSTVRLFDLWEKSAQAYHKGDPKTWSNSMEALYNETIKLGGPHLRPDALYVEYLYNRINPFFLSAVLYGLAFFFCLLPFFPTLGISASSGLIWIGFILHCAGIGGRMYILERPPVSTLYESILFVGLVCVLYGLIASLRLENKKFWVCSAAGMGVFLHILALSHNQDGDSFLMLTAVLNTNFWLATHVLCITAGYGFCLLTSFLAHVYFFKKDVREKRLYVSQVHFVALTALLFSAVGTVLGGIWADQSWGRFWGWDPKENGALLIVLWLVWILHGRISGQMGERWVMAGLAYLSVIVALSWFGVNFLSIGLHAYGFTDSAAWGLGGFIVFETLFIMWACLRQGSPAESQKYAS